MIRLIITIASLLAASICSSQVNSGKALEGNFNGKLCGIGRGLCTIKTVTTLTKSTIMKNYTTYKQSENTMVIELDAANLSKEDQIKFFGKEYANFSPNEALTFVQDEDFVFDMDTLIYLDFDINYQYLKKGTYPISIIKDKVLVTLTLSK